MMNRPYLLNYVPMPGRKVLAVKAMGRAVLVNGKVQSVTSGVGRVAHAKIVKLALSIARKEHEADLERRGVDQMTVEFHVTEYNGEKRIVPYDEDQKAG